MQIVKFLPPVEAMEKPDSTKPIKLQTKSGKNYHVQLPPGYNHARPWPVLICEG